MGANKCCLYAFVVFFNIKVMIKKEGEVVNTLNKRA